MSEENQNGQSKIVTYQDFDFNNNIAYQQYIKDLYPPPSSDKVEKFKQKWYKQNIDKNFEISVNQSSESSNSKPQMSDEQKQQQESQQQKQQQQQQSPPQQQQKPQQKKEEQKQSQQQKKEQQEPKATYSDGSAPVSPLYHVENILKIFFFATITFMPGVVPKVLTGVICMMGLIRNKGMIKFNKEYAADAFQSEFFTNIIYLIGIAISKDSLAFYFPLAIHFISGIAEYMIKIQHGLYRKVGAVKKLMDFVKENRDPLIVMKQKVEIYLTFYSLFGVFIGLTSIFQFILMIQYLGIKNGFNKKMTQAQNEFQYGIRKFADSSNCPGILKKVLYLFLQGYNKLLGFLIRSN